MEKESEGKITFLDVLVYENFDGILKRTIETYTHSTPTTRTLMKVGVARCLCDRAKIISSVEKEEKSPAI